MERKRKILAALADLKQEIAGPVPVDLISSWQKSAQDEAAQNIILKPFELRGYLVSSDSAGLSKLTAERDLIEVMNIVSEPKEIIYSHGIGLGGRGVGIWYADNTMMFYPESAAPEEIIDRMAAAQKQIHSQLLQVGMAVHKGLFWEINGGMFGEDAVMLEEAAENYTDAKEIIISQTVKDLLPFKFAASLAKREDMNFQQSFYSVNYDNLGNDLEILREINYPLPFSREFFLAMKKQGISEQAKDYLNKQFVNKVVVLIRVYHQQDRLLLNQLTQWVVVNAVINEILLKYDLQMVKSNGELGIFVANSAGEAVQFAEEVFLAMVAAGDQVSIGVSAGEVLLFKLDNGAMDIAGGVVNLASKISEDIAERNTLYIHESVDFEGLKFPKYEKFTLEKSKVSIRGYRYIG